MTCSTGTRKGNACFVEANGSSHVSTRSSCSAIGNRWNNCCFVYSVYGRSRASCIPYEVGKIKGEGIIASESMIHCCSSDGFTTIDKRSNDILIGIRTWIVAYHTGWSSFIYSINHCYG
jgi:hypothetical protein